MGLEGTARVPLLGARITVSACFCASPPELKDRTASFNRSRRVLINLKYVSGRVTSSDPGPYIPWNDGVWFRGDQKEI